MRILFVTAAFLPESIGGVELHVHGIASRLASEHDVRVFCRSADPSRPELERRRDTVGGVGVTRLAYRFSDCDRFEKVYRNPAIAAAFAAELAEFEPDVVHVHHLTCLSTDLVAAARQAGARVVMTLHDFWMGCPRGQRMTPDLEWCPALIPERCAPCLERMWSGWFGKGRDGMDADPAASRRRDVEQLQAYHEWIRETLLSVDRLITPSAAAREVFVGQGIPRERIRVVENGLDLAAFAGSAGRAGAADGSEPEPRPFRIGCVGSLLPTKGAHVLLEAFLRLDDPRHELHFHGVESGWHEIVDYGARLRARARAAGGRVVFHGRYETAALPSILRGLDVLVVPSIWPETFSLTLREGWLAGVPVLASGHGAMAEAIEHGETGLCFAPGDAADLAARLRQLHDDPPLRRRLARADKPVRDLADNAAELLSIYRAPAPAGGRGAPHPGRTAEGA